MRPSSYPNLKALERAAIWLIVYTFILISVGAFLGVIACEPDLVNYTPTPTLAWDPVEYADGYGLYMRTNGGGWAWLADLSCWHVLDEEAGVYIDGCYGIDIDVPVQRFLTDHEFTEVEFAVDAYNEVGRSESLSNTVLICMPGVWEPGEVYE